MKAIRTIALAAIVVIATLATGCLDCDYRLSWSVGTVTGAAATRGGVGWVEREVYYAIAFTEAGAQGAFVRLADENGIEPTGDVKWSLSNPDIGAFDTHGPYPPGRRAFNPTNPGEGIISAEYAGQIDACRIIVLPAAIVNMTKSLDVDGDGVADVALLPDDSSFSFPFGVQIYRPVPDFLPDPNALGDMPGDLVWPADSPTTCTGIVVDIVYFKTSSGALYAAQLRRGSDRGVVSWRKLRDMA